MRYREDGPAGVPAYGVTDDFLLATIVLTLFIGIVFVLAGRHGRQLWLTFWGWLSILVCSVYLVLMAMDVI